MQYDKSTTGNKLNTEKVQNEAARKKCKGHSIVAFSQNDQNLDPLLPSCLHLFDFGNPSPHPPANIENFTSSPHYSRETIFLLKGNNPAIQFNCRNDDSEKYVVNLQSVS